MANVDYNHWHMLLEKKADIEKAILHLEGKGLHATPNQQEVRVALHEYRESLYTIEEMITDYSNKYPEVLEVK